MKNYFDMRSGIINLIGIRTVRMSDEISYGSNTNRWSISIYYKGMTNQIFYYQDKALRDKIFEEIREKLLGTK